ncbi:MAG: putative serine protease [Frankiales bacterium]|nr:putative serine protease [Frankiales bacterium]
MHGDLLDVLLLVASLLFAVSGYRQGFVVGVLSFVGFLGGGVLGAKVAPSIAQSGPLHSFPEAVVGLAVVFIAASIGQVLATVAGAALRNRLTFKPARQADAIAGAAVSVISLLLVSWLVGTAVASSPFPRIASQVRRSYVLATVDGLVPEEGKTFFASFRRLINDRGFPDVIGPFSSSHAPDVPAPDPRLANSPVVLRAREQVLKITGEAPSCGRRIEGTGFVYAAERVMTNAHVVAGVRNPKVEVSKGKLLDAKVVLFDSSRDVAVLAVPGLNRTPLTFGAKAHAGADAIVVGYPQDGPFTPVAARVAATQKARGPDIYQSRTVTREIYALRARVLPGNSGGPLLSPEGAVYGVIFAAAADDPKTGYALTAAEVSSDARRGATATDRVSTRGCD